MHEPDDFGMDAVGTLAQVAAPRLAAGHTPYWTRWRDEVFSVEPELRPVRTTGDEEELGALGVTHILPSMRDVRVGCRVTAPEGAARGWVVASHGYSATGEIEEDAAWAQRGVGVLRIRARGFAGSHLDVGRLDEAAGGWIVQGIESPGTWVMRGATADLVNALRAARRLAGEAPVMLHGESFGAGLGVIAAAQMAESDPVERLAIGLPTFGDWRWRLGAGNQRGAGIGSGAEVCRAHRDRREFQEELAETLCLFDAVVHAGRVASPTVCKLALRDDVVPAPSAAAIFNALGTSPGLKWRFLTKYGHFDGGLSDLRRHALFERLVGDFFDPGSDCARVMSRWGEALISGERGPAGVG